MAGTYPKGLEAPSPLFRNVYECACGNIWEDVWDSACDDDCGACGADVSPAQSEDVTPVFRFESVTPDALRVGDVVEGNGALWRILARDVPAGGASTVTRITPAMVEAECVNDRGVDAFHVGYRKQFTQEPRHSSWSRLVGEAA